MRTLYLICFLCLSAGVFASTNEAAKVTKATVVKAIMEFRAHPLTIDGKAAAGKIVEFAEQSDDVSVHIAKPLVPWLHDGTDERYRALLLGAYIAGNVKSQLDHGVKRDDPHAGMLVVFDIYRQIKNEDDKCRIPEIEEFIELESKRKLKAHLEILLQTEMKKESQSKASNP